MKPKKIIFSLILILLVTIGITFSIVHQNQVKADRIAQERRKTEDKNLKTATAAITTAYQPRADQAIKKAIFGTNILLYIGEQNYEKEIDVWTLTFLGLLTLAGCGSNKLGDTNMTADLSKDRKSFTLKSAEGLAQQLKFIHI